jgi:hypothetical protein
LKGQGADSRGAITRDGRRSIGRGGIAQLILLLFFKNFFFKVSFYLDIADKCIRTDKDNRDT